MIVEFQLEKLDMPELPDACASCAHFRNQELSGLATCAAFPVRIPAAVMSGRNDHTSAIAGDNGIQWVQHPDWGTATPEQIAEFDAALARGEIPGLD